MDIYLKRFFVEYKRLSPSNVQRIADQLHGFFLGVFKEKEITNPMVDDVRLLLRDLKTVSKKITASNYVKQEEVEAELTRKCSKVNELRSLLYVMLNEETLSGEAFSQIKDFIDNEFFNRG